MNDLKCLVTDKITSLGPKEAAKFFGVSSGTISNWSSGKTSPSIDALQLVYTPPEVVAHTPELVQWEGKNVIILLPVYRTFHPETHYTLFANYARYGLDKVGLIQESRTVIHEARNILADKFLKTDAEYAIMVDDDMILPHGNAARFNGNYKAGVNEVSAGYNTISRLMSHSADKEIVGALYFGRHPEGKAQCFKGFHNEQENSRLHKGEYSGLMLDRWVGFGCVRIHRNALLKMAKEIDSGRWPDCSKNGNDGWYGFFTPLRTRVGEDVSFCLRAEEIGVQTYIDTSLVCLHAGTALYGPTNTKH